MFIYHSNWFSISLTQCNLALSPLTFFSKDNLAEMDYKWRKSCFRVERGEKKSNFQFKWRLIGKSFSKPFQREKKGKYKSYLENLGTNMNII